MHPVRPIEVQVYIPYIACVSTSTVSEDDNYILTAISDGTARVWAVDTTAEQASLPESVGELLALARTRVTRELMSEEQ
jgi:WD40 repeat protein